MAAYTIEDIELIRRKSGISYQEAVALLEYHNGNVARALVDLERNGRIQPGSSAQANAPAADASAAPRTQKSSAKSGIVDFLTKLYRARVKITKDEMPIINLSALAGIIGLIFAPHMVIAGAIASLVLGYRFSFVKDDPDFSGANLERMVRSAADNVKASVNDFARGFQNGANSTNGAASGHPYAAEGQAAEETAQRSYYTSSPAASASYRASVPTMNVPVQVESQDGSVTVEGDSEGYTSATIE